MTDEEKKQKAKLKREQKRAERHARNKANPPNRAGQVWATKGRVAFVLGQTTFVVVESIVKDEWVLHRTRCYEHPENKLVRIINRLERFDGPLWDSPDKRGAYERIA